MTPRSILIIEDNEDLREITVELLSAEGHQVIGVDSAEAASAHASDVDLMLVDLNLPGEDGLSLTRRMRSARPDLGIIILTARGLPGDIKLGYDAGADLYLPKPVEFEQLMAAIAGLPQRCSAEHSGNIPKD